MKKYLWIILVFSLSIACGNAENKASDTTKNEQTGNDLLKVSGKSPCELLSEADIKKQFSLPDDAVAEIQDVVRTYPTCFYKWESITVPIVKVMSGTELTLDYPSEISLVLVAKANQAMFETSTKVYKDGEQVEGLGDMAMWGKQMSQLTFLAKGNMMHLHVMMSVDAIENKENAIVLAKKIIAKL